MEAVRDVVNMGREIENLHVLRNSIPISMHSFEWINPIAFAIWHLAEDVAIQETSYQETDHWPLPFCFLQVTKHFSRSGRVKYRICCWLATALYPALLIPSHFTIDHIPIGTFIEKLDLFSKKYMLYEKLVLGCCEGCFKLGGLGKSAK